LAEDEAGFGVTIDSTAVLEFVQHERLARDAHCHGGMRISPRFQANGVSGFLAAN
jgi:hypothetical protein